MIWTNNPIGIKDVYTNCSCPFESLEKFWWCLMENLSIYYPRGFVDFQVFLEDRTDFNHEMCNEYFDRIIDKAAVYSEGFIFFGVFGSTQHLEELKTFGKVLFDAINEPFDPIPLERAFLEYKEKKNKNL